MCFFSLFSSLLRAVCVVFRPLPAIWVLQASRQCKDSVYFLWFTVLTFSSLSFFFKGSMSAVKKVDSKTPVEYQQDVVIAPQWWAVVLESLH